MRNLSLRALVFCVLALHAGAALAHRVKPVELKVEKLTDKIYMLTGEGGNMALSVGKDAVILVDSQMARMTPQIKAAIKKITKKPLTFVINTHWHFDHVGGNEDLARGGATIIAHDKVRERMSSEQFMEIFNRTFPPSPPAAWPIVTFSSDMTFYMNDDEIFIFHPRNAHTDGDTVVHFRDSNVIHMGDTFTNKTYPFIDTGSVGTVEGVLGVAEGVLSILEPTTKIIPGHGPLATPADLKAYVHMLRTVADRVNEQLKAGKSLEEVIASKPSQEFDAEWGKGFLTPDRFVEMLYRNLREYEYPAPGR